MHISVLSPALLFVAGLLGDPGAKVPTTALLGEPAPTATPPPIVVRFNADAATRADLAPIQARLEALSKAVQGGAAAPARDGRAAVTRHSGTCAGFDCECLRLGECGSELCNCQGAGKSIAQLSPPTCGSVCLRPTAAKSPAPPPVAPPASPSRLYQLTDASGQPWTSPDPAWLRVWVGQCNARQSAAVATQGFLAPLSTGMFRFGGGCAGGQCGR